MPSEVVENTLSWHRTNWVVIHSLFCNVDASDKLIHIDY